MKIFRIALASTALFGGASALAAGPHEVSAETMTFRWKIEGKKLTGTVRAKTTGWVGVGFNATRAMKDGMFVIGAEKDGKVKVENHFGSSERAHTSYKELGCAETVTNTSGKMVGEYTEISFTIPTDVSDKCSKPLNIDGDTKVLLAYGSGKKFTFAHPFKATMIVNLKTGAKK